MKKYIQQIYKEESHDGFMFILDDADMLDISAFTYKEPSPPIETHELGLKYHVITYREADDGKFVDADMFEAILGDPYHYGGHLINIGFFGTICKKTKYSLKLVTEMYEDLIEVIKSQEGMDEQPT